MGLNSNQIKRIAGMLNAAKAVEKVSTRRNKTGNIRKTSGRVYVGTYGKYNNGSIDGAWLDLDDYVDAEDFYAAALELHKDEHDPELMFQDWEDVPDWAISESHIDQKYWEYKEAVPAGQEEAFSKFIDWQYPGKDLSKLDLFDVAIEFEDSYRGEWNSVEDYAYEFISDIGFENIQNKEFYFNIDGFVRDLGFEGWHYANMNDVSDDPEEYPDGEGTYDPSGEFYSDQTLEDIVAEWLDEGIIGAEQIERYFDYEKFANDLELGGDIIEIDGHIFDAQ